MDNFSLFAGEIGFFVKMSIVAFIAIVAGILIRRSSAGSRREAVD
jgi:hypothetical protein